MRNNIDVTKTHNEITAKVPGNPSGAFCIPHPVLFPAWLFSIRLPQISQPSGGTPNNAPWISPVCLSPAPGILYTFPQPLFYSTFFAALFLPCTYSGLLSYSTFLNSALFFSQRKMQQAHSLQTQTCIRHFYSSKLNH